MGNSCATPSNTDEPRKVKNKQKKSKRSNQHELETPSLSTSNTLELKRSHLKSKEEDKNSMIMGIADMVHKANQKRLSIKDKACTLNSSQVQQNSEQQQLQQEGSTTGRTKEDSRSHSHSNNNDQQPRKSLSQLTADVQDPQQNDQALISYGNLAADDDDAQNMFDFNNQIMNTDSRLPSESSKQERTSEYANSYNQRVKDETNYLMKNKAVLNDTREEAMNRGQCDLQHRPSDALYNFVERKSYDQFGDKDFASPQALANNSQILQDSFDVSEFIPIEYYDSDSTELGIFVSDLKSPILYQRIVQKVNSIGSIRKLYYLFKQQRREILIKQKNMGLSEEYIEVCLNAIDQLTKIRERNLNYILKKLGMNQQQFDSQVVQIDKDSHTLLGLTRRVNINNINVSVEQAKEIKIKTSERVIELWTLCQKPSQMESDQLLQILQWFAEDEIFQEMNVELDALERLIQSKSELLLTLAAHQVERDSIPEKEQQEPPRMSMFTIDEGDEEHQDENQSEPCPPDIESRRESEDLQSYQTQQLILKDMEISESYQEGRESLLQKSHQDNDYII